MMPENNRRSKWHCCTGRLCLTSFPILAFASLLFSIIITYGVYRISVPESANGSVPFISDTGAHRPQSCVFAQLLNITAVIIGFTCYFRYKQVAKLTDDPSKLKCCKLPMNAVSFICGLLSAIGVSIVGNFQYPPPTLEIHFLGAGLAFFVGCGYIWMQTWISYKIRHRVKQWWLPHARLVICSLAGSSLLGMLVYGALFVFDGQNDRSKRDGTAICEWLAAVFDALYFITFFLEFKEFSVQSPVLVPYVSLSNKNRIGNENSVNDLPELNAQRQSLREEFDAGNNV